MTLSETNGPTDQNAETQPETSELSAGINEKLENGQNTEQDSKKAQELLAEGRRHLVCRSYQEAVDALDDACKLFCRLYGDMAFECAEVYFYYGKSLIELERINQNIVNVKDSHAENDEDMSDEDEQEEEDAEANAAELDQPSNEDVLVADIGAVAEVTQTKAPENQQAMMNGESSSTLTAKPSDAVSAENLVVEVPNGAAIDSVEPEVAGCSSSATAMGNDEKSEDEQEKDTNITIAWEMLDLARVIYEKKFSEQEKSTTEVDDKNNGLRLSEVRLALGEVCTLNERYADAVAEFTAAHEILKSVCSEDDRRLAEVFFQIGSVSELDEKYDDAAQNIQKARKVLELRKQNLQAKLLDQTSELSETVRQEMSREVEELVPILKDIDERLGDLAESQRNNEVVKENLRQQLAQSEVLMQVQLDGEKTDDTTMESKLAVTDVSHLVRKSLKRLSAGEGLADEQDPKRTKLEVDTPPPKAVSDADNPAESKLNGFQHEIATTKEPVTIDTVPAENGFSS